MFTMPGLTSDPWTLLAVPPGRDEEGNPNRTLAPIATGVGWFSHLSARARALAAQAGQTDEAVLATASTRFVAGQVVEVRGKRWRVGSVQDVRIHKRVMLAPLASGDAAQTRGA